MVRRVYPAAGVAVLVPGAADACILVDHGVADARFLQADRREDAGHAGANHEHVEVAPGGFGQVAKGYPVGILVEDLEFRHQELAVGIVKLQAGDEVHHLLDQFGRRRRQFRKPGVPVGLQGLQGLVADRRLLFGRNATLWVPEQLATRPYLAADGGRIAGQVHQGVDERRHVRLGKRGIDGLIAPGRPFGGISQGGLRRQWLASGC